MKHFILPFILYFLVSTASAQTLSWAKKMGGTQEEYVAAVSTDAQSNVYLTGYFNGTADFDPGAAINNLVSAGSSDIYVCKITSSGDFSWAVSVGGTGSDKASAVASDAAGNVYVAGFFSGTVDFDPGTGMSELTATGAQTDLFLLKLSSTGTFQWVKQLGNSGVETYCNLRADVQGNAILSSVFSGTIDMDPGPAVLNGGAVNQEGSLIVKISSTGNLVWGRSIVSSRIFAFSVDATGNLTLTGSAISGTDMDPGAGTSSVPSGFVGDVAVVFQLNTSGGFLWMKAMGSKTFPGMVVGTSANTDASGNVLVTGFFMGAVDLNPSVTVADTAFVRTSGGELTQWDIFLVKLSPTGSFLWGNGIGSTATDYGCSVIADASGNVWMQGMISGNTDFDPGSASNELTASGYTGYLAKYSATGQWMMVHPLAITNGMLFGMPWTPKLEKDASGAILSVGNFSGTMDAAPGSLTSNLTSAGSNDVYVSKLIPCAAPGFTAQPTSQNVCPGTSVTLSATPSGSGPFTYQWKKGTTILPGSGSTFTIASAGTANAGTYICTVFSACGTTTSANAVLTFKTATSIGTNPASTSACAGNNASFSTVALGTGPFSYVWKKGSTVVGGNSATLSLTNVTQANAGSYSLTATGACGNATSTPAILTVNTVSPVAILSNQSLSVSTPGVYQWLNCNTGNSPISGQTANTFAPSSSGLYAVRVTTSAGCIGTSPCVSFTVTGVEVEKALPKINFFPNPADNELNINSPEPSVFSLFDLTGKEIMRGDLAGGREVVNISSLKRGIYSLRINHQVFRLVK